MNRAKGTDTKDKEINYIVYTCKMTEQQTKTTKNDCKWHKLNG